MLIWYEIHFMLVKLQIFQVWIWNVDNGNLLYEISPSYEENCLTTVAWSPDGLKIACGGERGQFYQCDSEGSVLVHKEEVGVKAIAWRKDSKFILAVGE